MLTADLHSHTIDSPDSCNHYRWIVNRCVKVGINCLAVTDHNRIQGALKLAKHAPFRVIVGEEIDTGEGEIIGLFLREWIAPGRGLDRAIEEIKGQEGLVYLPHPLSLGRDARLNIDKVKGLLDRIDLVETFNSRTRSESTDNGWLYDWIHAGRVVKAAGSDAHSPQEFGNVLIEMDDFTTKEEFLASLAKAHFKVKKTSRILRLLMNNKARKLIRMVTYSLLSIQ